MTALAGLLVGSIAGTLLGHGFIEVRGAFIGVIAGFVVGEVRRSRGRAASEDPLSLLAPRVAERMRAMKQRIVMLERAIAAGLAPRTATTQPAAPPSGDAPHPPV
jgi:hypothetical protein